jgi:hypothetical protein
MNKALRSGVQVDAYDINLLSIVHRYSMGCYEYDNLVRNEMVVVAGGLTLVICDRQVRSSLGAEKVRAAEALEDLESERRGRHEASVELERMRTVFSQLDSMREELVAKLKSKFAEVGVLGDLC